MAASTLSASSACMRCVICVFTMLLGGLLEFATAYRRIICSASTTYRGRQGVHTVQIEGGLGCTVMLRALGGGELVVGSLLGSVIVCGPDVTSALSEVAAKWAAAYHAPSDSDMTKGADPDSSDPPLLGSSGHHSSGNPMEWLQSEAPPQELRLRPRSADASGLYAMDCLPLSHDRFLVAAHPSGLLVMRRCPSSLHSTLNKLMNSVYAVAG